MIEYGQKGAKDHESRGRKELLAANRILSQRSRARFKEHCDRWRIRIFGIGSDIRMFLDFPRAPTHKRHPKAFVEVKSPDGGEERHTNHGITYPQCNMSYNSRPVSGLVSCLVDPMNRLPTLKRSGYGSVVTHLPLRGQLRPCHWRLPGRTGFPFHSLGEYHGNT
uniref:Uncharacterized protein n=1 Tax=Candidatus Kentrum sp. LFY TaxID=2126342 RepID=A0A450V5R2_9GAMM|nr:MAG: hypothetical protein BECKLFY1418A_GA0070994_11126 [Candidatus Kentron sp. LFY]